MHAHESINCRDEHPLMGALAQGLPIALLVDLVDPNGPRSLEMLERERFFSDAASSATSAGSAARTA